MKQSKGWNPFQDRVSFRRRKISSNLRHGDFSTRNGFACKLATFSIFLVSGHGYLRLQIADKVHYSTTRLLVARFHQQRNPTVSDNLKPDPTGTGNLYSDNSKPRRVSHSNFDTSQVAPRKSSFDFLLRESLSIPKSLLCEFFPNSVP